MLFLYLHDSCGTPQCGNRGTQGPNLALMLGGSQIITKLASNWAKFLALRLLLALSWPYVESLIEIAAPSKECPQLSCIRLMWTEDPCSSPLCENDFGHHNLNRDISITNYATENELLDFFFFFASGVAVLLASGISPKTLLSFCFISDRLGCLYYFGI